MRPLSIGVGKICREGKANSKGGGGLVKKKRRVGEKIGVDGGGGRLTKGGNQVFRQSFRECTGKRIGRRLGHLGSGEGLKNKGENLRKISHR